MPTEHRKFGIRLADAGAEDGDSEDRDETDVDLAEEADQNDGHKDNQGNECETVHGSLPPDDLFWDQLRGFCFSSCQNHTTCATISKIFDSDRTID